MKRRAWSNEEIDYLRHFYADKRTDEIANTLGRALHSVHEKARSIHLRKSMAFLMRHRIQPGSNLMGGGIVSRSHTAWNKGLKGTTSKSAEIESQRISKISSRMKQLWSSDEFRRSAGKKIIQSIKERWRCKDYTKKVAESISSSMKRSWKDPSEARISWLICFSNLRPGTENSVRDYIMTSSMLKELQVELIKSQENQK